MDQPHDFMRSDTQLTTLPEYLRYREYTVPNPCPNVTARYKEGRKAAPAPPVPTFQPVTQFGAQPVKWRTPPRYLQPRARTPEPRTMQQYTESAEYEYHRRVSRAAGFGSAQSRLLDARQARDGELSPRDRVQQNRESNKRLTGWRSNPINGPSLTFDEIRNRNQQLRASFEAAMANKKNRAPSVVGDYLRHGTVINHHTMSEHYVSQRKKDFAPRWSAPGGSGGGRWSRGTKGPINRSTARTDVRVREYRARSQDRVVPKQHVPRVATLAPSFSLQRWEEQEAAGATDAGVSSESPAPRTPVGAPDNSNAERAELIEGPVTVSVPRGAVVRINSESRGN
eukprot:CAMPEP_0174840792 /NCGR_PEP_ID=MMETSP1114-20130205/8902_1 /TAXON_ID=312471 /ORGANISM="Neobodo designis, Strain CCAP 1951/1" /LENGTH=339 /DNA_ID=CAMNT_0016074959 /DNA_START=29 /DNA_END=1048 /DNA_ORIENTATION=+